MSTVPLDFSYAKVPLIRPDSQIRLLKITSVISASAVERPASIISCTLQRFDHAASPSYRALSYTWGNQNHRTAITINGLSYSVSQGLGTFLEQAGKWDNVMVGTSFIWIDQICIDQSREAKSERDAQVSMMGEIYRRATEVIVWLGPAEDDSHRAMRAMQGLERSELQLYNGAIKAFYKRPYWSRLWVVQELVLSRHGKVFCGTSWMEWRVLTHYIDTMLLRQKISTMMHRLWPMPESVLLIFGERAKLVEHRTLSAVLDMFGHFKCRNPLDTVYGLQALVPRHARVQTDYALNPFELWAVVVNRVSRDEDCDSFERFCEFAIRLQHNMKVDVSAETAEIVHHAFQA